MHKTLERINLSRGPFWQICINFTIFLNFWYNIIICYCSPESWQFTLKDKSHCIIPNGTSESDIKSCSIQFSVCKPLYLFAGLTNSSTCETVPLNDGTTHEYSIGDYQGNKGFEPLGMYVQPFTTLYECVCGAILVHLYAFSSHFSLSLSLFFSLFLSLWHFASHLMPPYKVLQTHYIIPLS